MWPHYLDTVRLVKIETSQILQKHKKEEEKEEEDEDEVLLLQYRAETTFYASSTSHPQLKMM